MIDIYQHLKCNILLGSSHSWVRGDSSTVYFCNVENLEIVDYKFSLPYLFQLYQVNRSDSTGVYNQVTSSSISTCAPNICSKAETTLYLLCFLWCQFLTSVYYSHVSLSALECIIYHVLDVHSIQISTIEQILLLQVMNDFITRKMIIRILDQVFKTCLQY